MNACCDHSTILPQRPFDYEFVFHSQKKLKFPDAIIEPQSDI